MYWLFQDRIIKLVDDDWWEVQAQLISYSCAMLEYCDKNKNSAETEKLMELLFATLNKPGVASLKTVALSSMAPQLKKHVSLCPLYCDLLLALTDEERRHLLNQSADNDEQLQLGASTVFKITSIPQSWYSFGIMQAMTKKIQEDNLQALDVPHFDIFDACLSAAGKSDEDLQSWQTLFKELQSYIFGSLSNEEMCESASEVIVKFFKLLQADALKVQVLYWILIFL